MNKKSVIIGILFFLSNGAFANDLQTELAVTASRLFDLTTCEHQAVSTVAFASVDNADVKEAKIKEALSDIDYYRARVNSMQLLLEKAKLDVKYDRVRYERAQKLIAKTAISAEEFETRLRSYEHSVLNVKFLSSKLAELQAELKSAEARLEQIKAADIPVAG